MIAVSTATGQAVGSVPTQEVPVAISIAPNGVTGYVANFNPRTLTTFTVATNTPGTRTSGFALVAADCVVRSGARTEGARACYVPASQLPLAEAARGTSMGLEAPGHGSEIVRPGWLMVPGGQYHVMISIASRPARTAGSDSASCRARASEPVR